ncbi:MAG: site-specific DNA-methyltransferase [Rhodanobacteraceae bacterium]|nr:site-specific DNA-methyltransferase [Rhodanobacteraceae bacterium]
MAKLVYEDDYVRLYHGKNRVVTRELLEQGTLKIDTVVTDPPYSERTQNNSKGATGRVGKGAIRDRPMFFKPFSPKDVRECVAWLATLHPRWMILFSDDVLTGEYRTAARKAGVLYVRQGVWVKTRYAPRFVGDGPAAAAEYVNILHTAGERRWNGGGHAAIYLHQYGGNSLHPTVKPLGLMLELIRDFTEPEKTVFDPYAGTGTTLLAARQLKRRAVGIEENMAICREAEKRLNQPELPGVQPDVARSFTTREMEMIFAQGMVVSPDDIPKPQASHGLAGTIFDPLPLAPPF